MRKRGWTLRISGNLAGGRLRLSGRLFEPRQFRSDPAAHLLAQRLKGLQRADHDLEFGHFAGLVEPDQVDALQVSFADIGGEFQRDIVRTGHELTMVTEILEDLHHGR